MRRSAASPPSRAWLAAYPPGLEWDVELPRAALPTLLDDSARAYGDRPALVFLGATLTYAELRDAVDRFAGLLRALGVARGDRVAVVLPNCPQNVIAFFGTLRLGAVVVEHNPLYTESELREQLRDCGARVVVCLDRTFATVQAARAGTDVQTVVVTSLADFLPVLHRTMLRLPLPSARARRARLAVDVPPGPGVHQLLPLLRRAPAVEQVAVDPDELAVLQYTGGTTGRARGAMLSHANLVANAHQSRQWLGELRDGRETTLAVLPLFHSYGLTMCLLVTVLVAGKLVLLPRFDLNAVFAAIDEHHPTLFPGVPPIYKALVDSAEIRRHDLRSIRACICGAMKLPRETQEQFERITGGRLVEGYGLTETSPATHANPLVGPGRPGSVGLPLPATDAKIVDPEDPARDLPPGAAGELAVRGPQVFQGYWGEPDLPGLFTPDGYLLTGDVATMDDDGYFTIVDRKKELIIAGGFNVYPSEVEGVLRELDGIVDAAVVGVPNRYRGETVKAYVVCRPDAALTEADVQEHCAARLAAYKLPRLVEFRDELPRSAVGKTLRRVLAEEERAKAAPADLAAAPARRAPAKKTTSTGARAKRARPNKAVGEPAGAKQAATRKTAAKQAEPKKAQLNKAVGRQAATKKAAARRPPAGEGQP